MQLLLNGALLLSGGAIIDLDATIVFQLATFFLVYLVLRATVFGPMLKLFDARDTAIDGAKHKARELESDAEEQLREFEAKVKAAKVEAAAERDRLRQDGQRLERELVARARTEADKTMEDASRRMNEEASAVRAHMKESVPQMASQIAEKLLGRKAS
jgi:F-type H+-transporting ATPase subunit b